MGVEERRAAERRRAATSTELGEVLTESEQAAERRRAADSTELGEVSPEQAETSAAAERRRVATAADIGEVAPPPIAAQFPGEASPYPVGYTPPAGKVTEVDGKGRPTVITTPAGLRQYTPNSTMWKIGYRTSADYARTGALADNPVEAAEFLSMGAETGRPILIEKDVALRLQGQNDKEQFRALQEMGVIKRGSRFIPATAETDGLWRYETAASVKRGERAAGEREAYITQTQVAEQYDQSQRITENFKREHIELAGGNWVAIKDWNKLDDKYQSIGIRGGFDTMIAAIDKDAKDFREVNTKLPDGAWLSNADLMKIRASTPALHDILVRRGYETYQRAIGDAKTALAEYHNPDKDNYDITEALLKRDPELDKAVELLFDRVDVARIRYEKMPGLTIGKPSEREAALIKAMPALAAAAVITTATPVPFDDIIFWAVLGGLTVYAGIKVSEVVRQFKEQTGRKPTPADIIVVDSQGNYATALDVYPELKKIPPFTPPEIAKRDESIEVREMRQRLEGLKGITLPEYKEGVKGIPPEIVFLPTPAITPADITGQQAGLTAAQAVRQGAESDFARTATKVIPIDWNKLLSDLQATQKQEVITRLFDSLNRATRSGNKRDMATFIEEYKEAQSAIQRTHEDKPRVEPGPGAAQEARRKWLTEMERVAAIRADNTVKERMAKSYQRYLKSLALYDQAGQSYVASLNPQPLKGKVTAEVLAAFTSSAALQASSPAASRALNIGVQQYVKTFNATQVQAATQAMTQAEVKAAAKIATKVAIRQALLAMPVTETMTKTQIQALVQSLTNTATKTATRAITRTQAIARAIPATVTPATVTPATVTPATVTPATVTPATVTPATVTPATPDVPPPPPPPPPPPLLRKMRTGTATDKEKRQYIAAQPGVLVRRRGALRGESLWLVRWFPWGPGDRTTVTGAPPKGAKNVTGPGSVKASAVLVRGRPPTKAIRTDTGAVDDIIIPTATGITIKSVKDTGTKKTVFQSGDIVISEKEGKPGKTRTKIPGSGTIAVKDAGAGIEETRSGRRHIKLD